MHHPEAMRVHSDRLFGRWRPASGGMLLPDVLVLAFRCGDGAGDF